MSWRSFQLFNVSLRLPVLWTRSGARTHVAVSHPRGAFSPRNCTCFTGSDVNVHVQAQAVGKNNGGGAHLHVGRVEPRARPLGVRLPPVGVGGKRRRLRDEWCTANLVVIRRMALRIAFAVGLGAATLAYFHHEWEKYKDWKATQGGNQAPPKTSGFLSHGGDTAAAKDKKWFANLWKVKPTPEAIRKAARRWGKS